MITRHPPTVYHGRSVMRAVLVKAQQAVGRHACFMVEMRWAALLPVARAAEIRHTAESRWLSLRWRTLCVPFSNLLHSYQNVIDYE